jgi:hypothetical protein
VNQEKGRKFMPGRIEWAIEERVIYIEVWGYMNLEEMLAIDQRLRLMLDSGNKRQVYILAYSEDLVGLTVGFNTLLNKILVVRHPNLADVIAINSRHQSLLRYILDNFVKLAGFRYHRVPSLEMALKTLHLLDKESQLLSIQRLLSLHHSAEAETELHQNLGPPI